MLRLVTLRLSFTTHPGLIQARAERPLNHGRVLRWWPRAGHGRNCAD